MKKNGKYAQLGLRTLGEIIRILFNVFIMIATIAAVIFIYIYRHAPTVKGLEKTYTPQTSIIYDRTGGHILYKIHGEANRKIISHSEIPKNIRIATIAAEDDSFYTHFGFDVFSIFRALVKDIRNQNSAQGASTITQQLARNAFLTREKTVQRKIMELILAIKLEQTYSKDQILDMYLNQVPYGSNAYGIETAAETFFGKKAADLTLDESAFLAALTKATAYYSPYGNHSGELVVRQQKILRRVRKLELDTPEKVSLALKTDTLSKVVPNHELIDAPHFVFYALEDLEKKYGREKIEAGGLRIYTSLDYGLQKLAEKSIADRAAYNLTRYGAANAALVALNPKNGQILAMVGSVDYYNSKIDGQVNVAIRPRQPGSSFKPFVYAKAFELGYQPENLLVDQITNFGPDGSGKNYIPRNYDGKSHGVVTMRQALAMSLNIPAVKTLYLVGVDKAIEMAHRLGITTLNEKNRYGLSLAIGGGEVKLIDETAGFSVFANDGRKNSPDPFVKITDSRSNLLYQNQAKNEQVLDPQVARKIDSILSDNAARVPIFGPNNLLHLDDRTIAAKTGTTQDWKDAWTVGFTPSLVAGVWAGNNDGKLMYVGADGSYVAAPIWHSFMAEALKGYPEEKFLAYETEKTQPDNARENLPEYRTVYINKKTGEEISENKARKMDAKKVERRVQIAAQDLTRSVNSRFIDPFINQPVATK